MRRRTATPTAFNRSAAYRFVFFLCIAEHFALESRLYEQTYALEKIVRRASAR